VIPAPASEGETEPAPDAPVLQPAQPARASAATPTAGPVGTLPGTRCWFCQTNPADAGAALEVKLHKEAQREEALKLPRCKVCRGVHDAGDRGIGVGVIGGVVLSLPIFAAGHVCYGLLAAIALCAALMLVGYLVRKNETVVTVAYALAGALAAALVTDWLLRGVSQVVAAIVAAHVFLGLAILGVALGCRHGRRIAAARAAISTRPQQAVEEHPLVQQRLAGGWQLGPLEKDEEGKEEEQAQAEARPARVRRVRGPAWHDSAHNPARLYAPEPPKRCPACGTLTGGRGLLAVMGSAVSVSCVACGAWGCANCCHHHNAKGRPSQAIGSTSFLTGTSTVYYNLDWRHNACCGCGYEPGLLSKLLR